MMGGWNDRRGMPLIRPMEDRWLDRIALEQLLAQLSPADRDLMILVCELDIETGYSGPWPPTQVDIGAWIGETYEDGPLPESTVRYRRGAILAMWRGERGPLRRNRRRNEDSDEN